MLIVVVQMTLSREKQNLKVTGKFQSYGNACLLIFGSIVHSSSPSRNRCIVKQVHGKVAGSNASAPCVIGRPVDFPPLHRGGAELATGSRDLYFLSFVSVVLFDGPHLELVGSSAVPVSESPATICSISELHSTCGGDVLITLIKLSHFCLAS